MVICATRILRSWVPALILDCEEHKFLGLVKSVAVGVLGQIYLK